MMTRDRRIEDCIEAVCNKGCRAVWADIRALEQGKKLAETAGLAPEEARVVLRELKQIMAPYTGRCRIE